MMESLTEAAPVGSIRRVVEEAPLLLPPLFLAAAQAHQESIKKSLLCPAGNPSVSAPLESSDRKGKKMASFPVSGNTTTTHFTGKSVACSSSSRGRYDDEKGFARVVGGDNSGLSEVTKSREIGGGGKTSLHIRVIDGTLLIESADPPPHHKSSINAVSRRKKTEGSRRRGGAKAETTEAKQRKYCYSREEMESVRFVNVTEQRKVWGLVYGRLGGGVRREYEGLSMEKKHCCNNFRQRFDPTAPGRYCVVGGARECVNVFAH